MDDEELFTIYLNALRISKFKDYHEGIVILKTFIAMLVDVLDCNDAQVVNAFWAAGLNAIEMMLKGVEKDD